MINNYEASVSQIADHNLAAEEQCAKSSQGSIVSKIAYRNFRAEELLPQEQTALKQEVRRCEKELLMQQGEKVLEVRFDYPQKSYVQAAIAVISGMAVDPKNGHLIACANGLWYEAGGVADRFYGPTGREWLAKAECAHILLEFLYWLTDEQRQQFYQLINPGMPYPVNWPRGFC